MNTLNLKQYMTLDKEKLKDVAVAIDLIETKNKYRSSTDIKDDDVFQITMKKVNQISKENEVVKTNFDTIMK